MRSRWNLGSSQWVQSQPIPWGTSSNRFGSTWHKKNRKTTIFFYMEPETKLFGKKWLMLETIIFIHAKLRGGGVLESSSHFWKQIHWNPQESLYHSPGSQSPFKKRWFLLYDDKSILTWTKMVKFVTTNLYLVGAQHSPHLVPTLCSSFGIGKITILAAHECSSRLAQPSWTSTNLEGHPRTCK